MAKAFDVRKPETLSDHKVIYVMNFLRLWIVGRGQNWSNNCQRIVKHRLWGKIKG